MREECTASYGEGTPPTNITAVHKPTHTPRVFTHTHTHTHTYIHTHTHEHRFSTLPFSLDEAQLGDLHVHLTNSSLHRARAEAGQLPDFLAEAGACVLGRMGRAGGRAGGEGER